MKKILVFLLGLPLLSGCSKEHSEKVVSESPDKLVKVEVFGSKAFLDPWKTNIVIAGYGNQDTLTTEIYSDELSDKTVKIDWKSQDAADIIIAQTDGTNRTFHLLLNENKYSLSE